MFNKCIKKHKNCVVDLADIVPAGYVYLYKIIVVSVDNIQILYSWYIKYSIFYRYNVPVYIIKWLTS